MPLSASYLASSDPIVGPLINSVAFHGWWAIFWFLGLAVAIFFCAKKMSDFVEEISIRVRVSKAFLGGVILSSVTSVPETIAAVFGGINNEVTFPIYNEIGSNGISGVVLSALVLLVAARLRFGWGKKNGSKKGHENMAHMGRSNVLLFRIIFVFTVLLVIFINVKEVANYLYIPGIRISVLSFVPLIAFIWFAIWSYRHNDEGKSKRSDVMLDTRYKNYKVRTVWILFAAVTILLIVLAYINANTVESFSDPAVLGIPESSAAGIFLALSDGMPELTSTAILIWRGHTAVAVGAVAGSHLFNFAQIFITDAISTAEPAGTFAQVRGYIDANAAGGRTEEHVAAAQLQGFAPMIMVMAFFLALQTIPAIANRQRLSLPTAGTVIATYGAGFALSSTLLG